MVEDKSAPVGIPPAAALAEALHLATALRQAGCTGEILSVCHEPVTGAHVGPGMLALYFTVRPGDKLTIIESRGTPPTAALLARLLGFSFGVHLVSPKAARRAALARFDNRPPGRENAPTVAGASGRVKPPRRRGGEALYAQKHRQRFRRINCNRIMNGILDVFRAEQFT